MRAEDALLWRGGFATWADLRATVPKRAVARAVAEGRVVRARRGRYVSVDLASDRAAAAALGGVLSHESAARMLGLPTLRPPDVVHVTLPRARHTTPPPGVRVHRVDLAARDVRDGATTPERTALDCATVLPFADALAIADGVLREGLLSPAELRAAADETRGPGRTRRLRIAEAAHPGAANPFESGLRPSSWPVGWPASSRSTGCRERRVWSISPTPPGGSAWRPTASPTMPAAAPCATTADGTTSWPGSAGWYCGSRGNT